MAIDHEQPTTEPITDEVRELPEAAANAVCPWCCGPVTVQRHDDEVKFGHRWLHSTLICADCDLAILLVWPSLPFSRRSRV